MYFMPRKDRNMIKLVKKYILLILLILFVLLIVWMLKLISSPPTPTSPMVGNMNGVELSIPDNYLEPFAEYAGESVWSPVKNPPERTYKSGIDSFNLAVKWPSMQHKFENNNWDSYLTKRDWSNGPTDWLTIQVQNMFESAPLPEDKQRVLAIRAKGYAGLLRGYIDSEYSGYIDIDLPPNNHIKQQGLDAKTGLKFAKVEGPDADKPALGNRIVYWEGDVDGIVNTVITCPGASVPQFATHKLCTQTYYLPELHADITVDFYMQLLPDWKAIQQQTRLLILSFQHLPTNQQQRNQP